MKRKWLNIYLCETSDQSVCNLAKCATEVNTKLLGAMIAPCLRDLSKHDPKQVLEGSNRNLSSEFSS